MEPPEKIEPPGNLAHEGVIVRKVDSLIVEVVLCVQQNRVKRRWRKLSVTQ